jgi:hypothetical protein
MMMLARYPMPMPPFGTHATPPTGRHPDEGRDPVRTGPGGTCRARASGLPEYWAPASAGVTAGGWNGFEDTVCP